ncbi:MAG: VirB4-like conjugal transfer ATPase, CD1110 family [Candidatus Gracilibacteria bacterium]
MSDTTQKSSEDNQDIVVPAAPGVIPKASGGSMLGLQAAQKPQNKGGLIHKMKVFLNLAEDAPANTGDKAPTASKENIPAAAKTKVTQPAPVQAALGTLAPKTPMDAAVPHETKDTPLTPEEKEAIKKAEEIYKQGITSINSIIAPDSMDINFDKIKVSGMYVKTFFVYNYPRFIESNWLSPIINFDATLDISMFIYPIDSGQILKYLRNKVAQISAQIHINEDKGYVRDPALEAGLQDAEELRDQLQRGIEKFFHYGLYLTVYAETEKKLSDVSRQLQSMLGGRLILTKPANLQTEHAFNSTLPIASDELGIVRNMNTSPLSSTFPFSSSDLTSNEGILYGVNRHNDSLIIFDRFKLENANSVVFAKSGAGKSFAVKLEILRSIMLGSDVIVIDPEKEYKTLCDTIGGTFINMSLNSPERINPFDLPASYEGEIERPGDILRSNIITITGLLKLMLGDMTPAEEALIDKALLNTYALKGITLETKEPHLKEPPTIEDLFHILMNMKGGELMAERLQKFTTGTFSGIFNQPTNIDLNSGLVVFCIRDLEDSLRPIAMYIILNYIWTKVRSKLKKRILIVEEAWTILQHEDSAKFLYGIVKRGRKYYLGVTTITQDVEDMLQSSYGKPVITNSSMQLLLKQSPAAVGILAQTFNLTEGEKYMLLNSDVGQGLFFAGNKHVAIQIIASYTEREIITTNPEEIIAQNKAAAS